MCVCMGLRHTITDRSTGDVNDVTTLYNALCRWAAELLDDLFTDRSSRQKILRPRHVHNVYTCICAMFYMIAYVHVYTQIYAYIYTSKVSEIGLGRRVWSKTTSSNFKLHAPMDLAVFRAHKLAAEEANYKP
jgi:hypothetical protein